MVGARENLKTKSDSPFSEANYFLQNLSLNYAYRIATHWHIGAFYQTTRSEYEFEKRGNGSSTSELTTARYGLFTLYNFSENLVRSFYLGLAFSYFNSEEENSHDFTSAEGKAPFELDDDGLTWEMIFGKRFSLEKLGIKNLTYSPQVSLYSREHGKDFVDQKIRRGVGLTLQIIRFDLIF